ncbi:hypothetical protein L6272_03190, partial [Microgenomates group bacterium]|nr:hypothetical protein [Microgenomates group bacterium]
MKKFLSTSGFIDPISLITLGFLIVGLVVTTAIVKNPDINLDIRDWARMSTGRCPDGSFAPDGELKYCPKAKTPTKPAPAKQQTAPAQPPAPTQKQQQEQAPTEEKSEPVAAVQTPPKKTCTEGYLDTTGECRDGRMCRTLRSIECEITTLCDGPPCTANSARFIPTIPPPPATLPPPPPTYTCTNTAGQYCSPEGCGPNTFGTGSCPSFKTCCKPRPSPSPSPSPPPTIQPTITQAPSSSQTSQCSPACKTDEICSPTPYGYFCQKKSLVTTPDGTTKCDGDTLSVMKSGGWVKDKVCENGCANSACKPAPAPAKKIDSNAGLIATYNTLNAVTFGAFGNYVQTYQNINAQNPQASYLERAFNPAGVAASAQLGTVLTAEAAIVAS